MRIAAYLEKIKLVFIKIIENHFPERKTCMYSLHCYVESYDSTIPVVFIALAEEKFNELVFLLLLYVISRILAQL